MIRGKSSLFQSKLPTRIEKAKVVDSFSLRFFQGSTLFFCLLFWRRIINYSSEGIRLNIMMIKEKVVEVKFEVHS